VYYEILLWKQTEWSPLWMHCVSNTDPLLTLPYLANEYWHNFICSGIAKNVNWGRGLPFSFLFPPSFFLFDSSPPYLAFSPHFIIPPPRKRTLKIQLEGMGERCKLPQRGLRQSYSRRHRIWCFKICDLVGTISSNFLSINWPNVNFAAV